MKAALLVCALAWASAARADDLLSATAQWTIPKGQADATIVVPLGDALTQKQRSMIEGGFTTVSQLSLKLPIARDDERNDADLPVFHSVRCSVKFDAWEETFDVARLDESPLTATVKAFADYGQICLNAQLQNPNLLARMALSGGVILAYLVVKQTSQEEAGKIKDWLVQQQSGVMQGLFSHMLGDLSLSQTLRVRITVPPRPKDLKDLKG